MLKKSNIVSKKSNGPGKNPRDDTLRQRARREAVHKLFHKLPEYLKILI